jgi:hypothetical protein
MKKMKADNNYLRLLIVQSVGEEVNVIFQLKHFSPVWTWSLQVDVDFILVAYFIHYSCFILIYEP